MHPSWPLGCFLNVTITWANWVILVDYEVLVWQVTVATIFDFCFGSTFFLVLYLLNQRRFV